MTKDEAILVIRAHCASECRASIEAREDYAEALATLEALAAPPVLVGVESEYKLVCQLLAACEPLAREENPDPRGVPDRMAKLIEADRAAVTRSAELRLLERLRLHAESWGSEDALARALADIGQRLTKNV